MPKNQDGYFRTTFSVGKTEDGKLKRITIRAKTKKELDFKLAEAKRLYSYGYALADISVYEWADRWYTVYKANASETQKNHYRAKLNNEILPSIGSMRMRDVRASHLQEIINKRANGKLETVKKLKNAMRQLFEDAEIEGIIERSPAVRLTLPKTLTESPRRPLTPYEKSIVYNVAQNHKRGVYALTMLFCGLRRGECIALTVGDVDFERSRLIVNKSLSMPINVGIKKGTKSQAGMREVPIPDIILPILREWCADKKPSDILFPKDKSNNSEYITKQICKGWWLSFRRQCHITAGAEVFRNQIQIETSKFDDNITPHYLRHTYATDLYAAGVDEKARKFFLGHASNDVTDTYTKMSNEALARATAQINEYYSKISFDLPLTND
jgi:integrase